MTSDNPSPPPNQRTRLQHEIESLEKSRETQLQKVGRIRNAWVLETDPSEKFKYEKELEQEESILEELSGKLAATEQKLQTLVDSRLNLDSDRPVQYSSSPQNSFASSQPLPPLLPYLANRREQESQLSEVLQTFLEQTPANHLVCIIHGDELQCHYNFVERIRQLYLRKLLELDPQQPTIPKFEMAWPEKLKDLQNLDNQLCKNLVQGVSGNSFHSLAKINDLLSSYSPNPVIIQTHLLTEDLYKQGLDSLDRLLKFCRSLSKNIINQKLIICICIKYKITRKNNYKISWFKWILTFVGAFLKQYRYQQTNRKIRKYLQDLSNSELSHLQPISVIVLPELEGINKTEVENWVRSEYIKQLVGEAMIEPLIQKVGEMFATWEEQKASDTIPMYDLAEKLEQLLMKQGKSV
ncbi:MAG: hypothetical protein RMY28_037870 [Nostoc sp. ChiSLP01]|nr:hypothetical protein [Nostoc sp. CmiSLP01]MDZ8284585.1 hypothetical protein [Nostoc sp. ChiSLP01]